MTTFHLSGFIELFLLLDNSAHYTMGDTFSEKRIMITFPDTPPIASVDPDTAEHAGC
jgi:hypothetical protein